ncbi:MAG: T9SS type A sorting domain-containing protein [Flavobacteriales bacterium]|nr:T9SS type A sorting domain-containing protein [Flavobacteriales bacterium]
MKTQNIKHHIRAGNIVLTLWLCLLTAIGLQAQDLIVHLGYTPPLNQQQQKYLRTVTKNPINERISFVEINMEALKGERLTLNLGDAQRYEVQKVKLGQNLRSMTSWCGQVVGAENGAGDVSMVRAGQELVGHFAVENMIYSITHIGDGLHVLYEVNTANAPAEECQGHDMKPPGEKTKRPVFTDPDYVNNLTEAKSTDACHIRVLVGFTPQAEAEYTNLIAQINNLINLANFPLFSAIVDYRVELAHAYRVNYAATSENSQNLERWWGTSDGFMDEVHFLRGLWRADQCALIVPGDGGVAYLDLDYSRQFSVTGTLTFNGYTFHHELGHNMLCTHDVVNTTQPGTAPYAGYGHPSGCFRTVMAYQAACGTGPGTCQRANRYSSYFGAYFCDGEMLNVGNDDARNASRLSLSASTVINHEVAPTDGFYFGSYAATANEAIHLVSNLSLTYNGSLFGSTFTFFDGSEGSFQATDVVTLGPGFRANEGSFFEAYPDACLQQASVSENGGDQDDVPGPKSSSHDHNHANGKMPQEESVNVFPNPFNQNLTVEFTTHKFERVTIEVYNMMGQKVMVVLNKPSMAPGQHKIMVDTAELPSGMYTIVLGTGDERTVNKVIKNK